MKDIEFVIQQLKDAAMLVAESINDSEIVTFMESTENLWRTTPASTKFHNSFEGGLAHHTLNVVNRIIDIQKMNASLYSKGWNCTNYSAIKVALLHDIGKFGWHEREPMYLPEYEYGDGSDQAPTGISHFNYNKSIAIPHQDLSIRWAYMYDIPLTQDEHHAILYHNGLYDPAYQNTMRNERPLTIMLHMADMMAARFDETSYK